MSIDPQEFKRKREERARQRQAKQRTFVLRLLIAGIALAVSQITCMDSPELMNRREEFLMLMEQTAKEKGFSMVLLMLTDVLLEGTQLLFVGDEEIIRQAFNKEPKDGAVFLPQIMSRKKQVIPMLSALWG